MFPERNHFSIILACLFSISTFTRRDQTPQDQKLKANERKTIFTLISHSQHDAYHSFHNTLTFDSLLICANDDRVKMSTIKKTVSHLINQL